MEWILVYVPSVSLSRPGLTFPFSKEVVFSINSSRSRRRSLLIFEIQFPIPFMFIEDNQQDKVVTKKMYNFVFDEEDIPMVTKKEIMMNTGHRIQAGLMRHHLQYLMPRKQHQLYA